MSSISTKPPKSVGEYVSKLKEIRDRESQKVFRLWDDYIIRAQAPDETVESISAMFDADHIQIDFYMTQKDKVRQTRFPKGLDTVEKYVYWLYIFREKQTKSSSTWFYWHHILKIANEEGATVGSIEAELYKDRIKRNQRRKGAGGGVESSGTAANPYIAAAAASSIEAPKRDIAFEKIETTTTHGRYQPTQVRASGPPGTSSTNTRAPPQTSTTKATAAPANKPQSKPPVSATGAFFSFQSHPYPHSQSHPHSSSVSSARKQQRVVTSDRQRPRTPTKSTASVSTSRASPGKTVKSPTTTHTSHTISKHSGQRVASSPLNSPQKRKLSVSSGGVSMPNQSGQSKQPNQVQPNPKDNWDFGMFLEEETQDFNLLKNEFEMSNNLYDPFRRQ